ncbi:MAG TPA: Mur ligase family protein [Chitinophagaceae bacterium]|nr:Mur ligase family protein [Chitinophagaceae bacterium]
MRIHFIAIGGSVMHQLAIALSRKGYQVTGSDDEIFEPAASNLKKEGLLPLREGWYPEEITKDIDAVILGMHAKDDNPELQKARESGLQIFSFPEYIFKESENKKRVAIGGSHGKTTTTAMTMHVLKQNGIDFDYLVGAKLDGFGQSVQITDAPVIVCEADEYPASAIEKRPKFHFLFPHIAVITGIAWDHINVFPTFGFYLEQFSIFIEKIMPGGVLIYNDTDDVLKKLIGKNMRHDIQYIPYNLPTYFIEEGITRVIIGKEKALLRIFGNHNLLNLHAAYFVCTQLGVSDKGFAEAIATFSGAAKRLELLLQEKGYNIYRDFAHAPSKVKASIDAVKQQFPDRKLVAVLELHTFSSLNEKFMQEYAGAMNRADIAIVFYSRHALELKRMPVLAPQSVMNGFQKPGLKVITERPALEGELMDIDKENTSFLFMSSGNYDGMDILKLMHN